MNNIPYEKMLDQIAEIMQFAYDNAEKPISPEKARKLEQQLSDLEKKAGDLKKATKKIASEIGVSEYAIAAMREDPQSMVKDILKRAEDLKSEAAKGALNPVEAAQELKEKGTTLTGKKPKKKTTPASRKRKFRSMGEQDWKHV